MVVMEKLVIGERAMFLIWMKDLAETLASLETVLTTSRSSGVVDIASRHDSELTARLLALADANALVLDRMAELLEEPRDRIAVSANIAAMRAGVAFIDAIRREQS